MIYNALHQQLIDLKISTQNSIIEYYPQVRDRDDISVLKCTHSNIIFLSQIEHMDITYYQNKKAFSYWSKEDRQSAIDNESQDLHRRSQLLKNLLVGKKWLDIGTGAGGILDALSHLAKTTTALEPQKEVREALKSLGYHLYADIKSVQEEDFELVTLFHVFEHFTDPLEELKSIHSKMSKDAQIILEVPHANDFLLSFLEHESFKKFTFWSEHLLLHTRQSLTRYLQAAGFSDIIITPLQRYPLANHLHWLSKNAPGGDQKWSFLRTPNLDDAYAQMLASLDKSDTLLAYARK